jgi:hypothetical protein
MKYIRRNFKSLGYQHAIRGSRKTSDRIICDKSRAQYEIGYKKGLEHQNDARMSTIIARINYGI